MYPPCIGISISSVLCELQLAGFLEENAFAVQGRCRHLEGAKGQLF